VDRLRGRHKSQFKRASEAHQAADPVEKRFHSSGRFVFVDGVGEEANALGRLLVGVLGLWDD
jgi:hypothetical protein